MLTTNLETLKIHKLTKAQYERELAAGNIDASALYLTPEEEIDPRYMTKENPTGTGTLSLNGNSGTNIGGYAVELGYNTSSTGNYSFAAGYNTVASGSYNHVIGKYNVEDEMSNYISIVGNGDETTPSNAHTLDWDGNAWFAGDVTTASGASLNTLNSKFASSNLTASRALISNSSGKIAVSDVTSTELGYLDGVTSNIQTQLNGKQAKIGQTNLTGKSVSVANKTAVTVTYQYFAAGTWLVFGHALIPTGATANPRKICLSTTTTFDNNNAGGCQSAASFSTNLNCWALMTFTAETKVNLLAYHENGSTVTVTNGKLTGIKLA